MAGTSIEGDEEVTGGELFILIVFGSIVVGILAERFLG